MMGNQSSSSNLLENFEATQKLLAKSSSASKVVVISDTHLHHRSLTEKIPACDILIHCGDFSMVGSSKDISDFADWLGTLKQCKHIVVIAVSISYSNTLLFVY